MSDRTRSLRRLLHSRRIDRAIDVGANAGKFIRLLRNAGYGGPVAAFEPLVEHHAELRALPGVELFPAALGGTPGHLRLNVYSDTDFSSQHVLGLRYGREYANSPRFVEVRDVQVNRLDDLQVPGDRLLLKVDVQGAEVDVLRGARDTLSRVEVLYVEVPFLQIYEQGGTAGEIFSLARSAGLYPARFFANSITSWGAWVDGDVVFVREPRDA